MNLDELALTDPTDEDLFFDDPDFQQNALEESIASEWETFRREEFEA